MLYVHTIYIGNQLYINKKQRREDVSYFWLFFERIETGETVIIFTVICKKSTGRLKEIFLTSFAGIEKDEK